MLRYSRGLRDPRGPHTDLATLILRKGLKRATPSGLFKKLGSFFTSDKEHQVDHCVNLSGQDTFFGLPLTGTLAHVSGSRPFSIGPLLSLWPVFALVFSRLHVS